MVWTIFGMISSETLISDRSTQRFLIDSLTVEMMVSHVSAFLAFDSLAKCNSSHIVSLRSSNLQPAQKLIASEFGQCVDGIFMLSFEFDDGINEPKWFRTLLVDAALAAVAPDKYIFSISGRTSFIFFLKFWNILFDLFCLRLKFNSMVSIKFLTSQTSWTK